MRGWLALVLTSALAAPVHATERRVLLSDFDRVEVNGDYAVDIVLGRSAPARVIGAPKAIEQVRVEVRGNTLVIRAAPGLYDANAGRDYGDVRIRVAATALRAIRVDGRSNVSISRLAGPKLDIGLGGSGQIDVTALSTSNLSVTLDGAGRINMTGRAAEATIALRGSGIIDGQALTVGDLDVKAEGSGNATLSATKTARIDAVGTPTVNVTGTAACTVRNTGMGTVTCGR